MCEKCIVLIRLFKIILLTIIRSAQVWSYISNNRELCFSWRISGFFDLHSRGNEPARRRKFMLTAFPISGIQVWPDISGITKYTSEFSSVSGDISVTRMEKIKKSVYEFEFWTEIVVHAYKKVICWSEETENWKSG